MRKILLCLGLSMAALSSTRQAHAQFAPEHSASYLDSRRDSELRHQTLSRMLMTMNMDPGDEGVVDTSPLTQYRMPTHRFEPEEGLQHPPRQRSAPDEQQSYHSGNFFGVASHIPAVVQVNREIGLSVTGAWSNYKEKFPWQGASTGYDRETGWVPGFQLDVADMFDTYEIDHVFVAAHFALGDGDVSYKGSAYNRLGDVWPLNSTSHRMTTDSRIEIGKGLMVNDRFMITPTIVGGYWSWNRDIQSSGGVPKSSEAYGGFLAGIQVRLDYAITDAFVLRGRLAWTELLGSRMDAANARGTFHLRPRPEWTAALDFDYRIARSLHVIGGVQYTYYSFGRSQLIDQHNGFYAFEPSSWTNGVTLHSGVAYGF